MRYDISIHVLESMTYVYDNTVIWDHAGIF